MQIYLHFGEKFFVNLSLFLISQAIPPIIRLLKIGHIITIVFNATRLLPIIATIVSPPILNSMHSIIIYPNEYLLIV